MRTDDSPSASATRHAAAARADLAARRARLVAAQLQLACVLMPVLAAVPATWFVWFDRAFGYTAWTARTGRACAAWGPRDGSLLVVAALVASSLLVAVAARRARRATDAGREASPGAGAYRTAAPRAARAPRGARVLEGVAAAIAAACAVPLVALLSREMPFAHHACKPRFADYYHAWLGAAALAGVLFAAARALARRGRAAAARAQARVCNA